jgi:hypothetical protein
MLSRRVTPDKRPSDKKPTAQVTFGADARQRGPRPVCAWRATAEPRHGNVGRPCDAIAGAGPEIAGKIAWFASGAPARLRVTVKLM